MAGLGRERAARKQDPRTLDGRVLPVSCCALWLCCAAAHCADDREFVEYQATFEIRQSRVCHVYICACFKTFLSLSITVMFNKKQTIGLGARLQRCLKPMMSYVQDHIDRWTFFKKWIAEGTPIIFWFSAYFFQQASAFARLIAVPSFIMWIWMNVMHHLLGYQT